MVRVGIAPYLECSSKGFKKFSAFYAKIDGVSIEEIYQSNKIFEDGSSNLSWQEVKEKEKLGIKCINMDFVSELYESLWRLYLGENPELYDILLEQTGLSDIFGRDGHNCQAITLWKLRGEFIEYEKKYHE